MQNLPETLALAIALVGGAGLILFIIGYCLTYIGYVAVCKALGKTRRWNPSWRVAIPVAGLACCIALIFAFPSVLSLAGICVVVAISAFFSTGEAKRQLSEEDLQAIHVSGLQSDVDFAKQQYGDNYNS